MVRKPANAWHPSDGAARCAAAVRRALPVLSGPDLLPGSEQCPTTLTDLELSEAYEKIAQLRIWINAIEREVYDRLSHGKEVPSAKLVQKKANRVFGHGAEEAAHEKYGEDAYEAKLKSPAKLEKLPGGAAFVKRWAFAPDTGLTVAPAGDKRSVVKARTAEQAFANIET
jgi:hypothetical protein